MSLRMHMGHWTIFSESQPIASFPNWETAWAAIWTLSQEVAREQSR